MEKVSVEQFVRFLIHLGGIYNVDDEGYIVNKGDDNEDPVMLKSENKYRPLMVMKDVIKDSEALVINPLNENITETPDSKWLYTCLSTGLARRILEVARHLRFIMENDKNDEIPLNTDEVKFAAMHNDFNSKSLEAINAIGKKYLNFSNVGYNRRQKEAKLRCSIYDPDTFAEFPQFSNKAWKSVTKLISNLLGISEDVEQALIDIDEKYRVKSDLINVPRLEATLQVYYNIYSRLNQFLDLCNYDDQDFVIDMTEFGYHLNNLQDYYNKAKWFVNPVVPQKQERPVYNAIPTNIPMRNPVTNVPVMNQNESNIPANPLRGNMDLMQYHTQPQPTFQQMPFQQQPFQPMFQQPSFQQPSFQQPMQSFGNNVIYR